MTDAITSHPAITDTSPGPVDLKNVLLTSAWLGELTREQYRRLHLPDKSEASSRRLLHDLEIDRKLLQKRRRAKREIREGKTVTVHMDAVWSLTPAGHTLIKEDAQYPYEDDLRQYPAKPANPRGQQVLEHDLWTTTHARSLATARRCRQGKS